MKPPLFLHGFRIDFEIGLIPVGVPDCARHPGRDEHLLRANLFAAAGA
ncbi:hypothetical protein [Burkholderia paludis]|nr:hypothetical protein [Burkholderia paludis]